MGVEKKREPLRFPRHADTPTCSLPPRRSGGLPDDELWREYQCLRRFTSSEPCKKEFHGAFTHFLHWLGDHGQRRIPVGGPKRVVENHNGYFPGNGDTFVADESNDAGGHLHICYKKCSGRTTQRKQLLRALITGLL